MLQVEVVDTKAMDWVLAKVAAKSQKPAQKVRTPRQDLAPTKEKELDLWRKWKEGGKKPEDLDPLIDSFERLLKSRTNVYSRAEVPTAAISYQHKLNLVDALNTYDPSKGTALGTHVRNKLLRTSRYVESKKNFARISENVYANIGAYNNLKSQLTEQLGFEPDDRTLHEHALTTKHEKLGKCSLRQIIQLGKQQRKALLETGMEGEGYLSSKDPDYRETEVLGLVYFQLSPEEKAVYDYTFGSHGKAKLSNADTAKAMKIDPSKVSKLRTKIYAKIKPYLNR